MTRNAAAAGVSALLAALFASGDQIWASVLLALVCGWFARSSWTAFDALPDTPHKNPVRTSGPKPGRTSPKS